jgi:magnesium transporter
VSFRELFSAAPVTQVRTMMHTDVVTVDEQMDQEAVSRVFAEHDLIAIPVVDAPAHERYRHRRRHRRRRSTRSTEDIQKIGGTQVLDAPYLSRRLLEMVKKRWAGWRRSSSARC